MRRLLETWHLLKEIRYTTFRWKQLALLLLTIISSPIVKNKFSSTRQAMKLTFLVSKVFQKMETLPFTFKRYSALRTSLYFLDEVSGLYYQRCLHVLLGSGATWGRLELKTKNQRNKIQKILNFEFLSKVQV